MKTLSKALSILFALVGTTRAQDEATTLARLCDRAEFVAVVRQIGVATLVEDQRTVRFQVVRTLKGEPGTTVAFTEPALRGCGRALFGTIPGLAYLAFWTTNEDGARLATSSARALITLEPGLMAHVAALVAARANGSTVATLAEALGAGSQRVREDAALALAHAPDLGALGAPGRNACAAALTDALADLDPRTPALLTVARRLALPTTIAPLVHATLGCDRADWSRWFAEAAAEIDPSAAAMELERHGTRSTTERDRAIVLLERLPVAEAAPALRALLASDEHRHVVAATRLLLRLGTMPAELAPLVAPAVLEEAAQDRVLRPRFRAIRPETPR